MRNIWRIFRADWQRISASVVAVVVIMGLCLIPCLYAWFNIFSNWDPYGPDATSNIRVAVTSEDEGYELLGLKLNIGSMVLDGLKSNDQMGWDFVDSREEALEGVRSGRYYAALIVPADFTGDFVSILDTDLRHPQIVLRKREEKRHCPQDHQQGQDRRSGRDQRHRGGDGDQRRHHRQLRVQGSGPGCGRRVPGGH